MLKVLIIGYGSIGKKHEAVFKELGITPAIFSNRQQNFESLTQCLEQVKPHIIVIANKTSEHFETLKTVISNTATDSMILVEKPLFDDCRLEDKINIAPHRNIFVAYNLRHHHLIKKVKKIIQKENVISAHIYCGQYLPTWRPHLDYRNNYSAIKNEGGGVLRDLSHELDYSSFLFGKLEKVSSFISKLSDLEIETEDTVSVLGVTQYGTHINLSVNYIDHGPQRHMTINTNKHTYTLDMIKNVLSCDGEAIHENSSTLNTYIEQAKALISNDRSHLCTYSEGLETLNTINKIELSNRLQTWIKN